MFASPLVNPCKPVPARLNRLRMIMAKYAVVVGRKVGVFDSWAECQEQVLGYPKAVYKKFNTQNEAESFLRSHSTTVGSEADSVRRLQFVDGVVLDKHQSNKVESNPSSSILDGVYKRISSLEEKFNKYVMETTSKLEAINSRLICIERKRSDCPVEDAEEKMAVKKIKLEKSPDQNDFVMDEKGFVVVFTDGACSSNGKAGAKAGIGVWFNYDHPLNVSTPVKGSPTNNTAEIQAARVAIDQAKKAMISKLSIHTDSQFLIKCITCWIYKWKKNGWKLANGENVKNKDELVKLDNAIKSLNAIQWIHVKGHSGNVGNEMADKLARAGAEQYQSNLTFGV